MVDPSDHFDYVRSICHVSQIFFFFFPGKLRCRPPDRMDASAANKKNPSSFFLKSCVVSLFGFPKRTSDIQPWSVPVTLGSILGGCYTSCPQCVLSNTHTHMIATSELRWTEPVTKVCGFRSHRTWKCFDWCNYSWGVRVGSAPHIHLHCLDFSACKQAHSQSALEMTDLCSVVCAT